MAQTILISTTAPKEERGYWSGVSNASSNFVKFAGPLLLSVLYSYTSDVTVLALCGAISLLAFVAYLPLGRLVPKPLAQDLQPEAMEVYEAMPAAEFRRLPLQLRQRIDNARRAAGKPSFQYGWGGYDEQRPFLRELLAASQDDFAYLKSVIIETLTNRKVLASFQSRLSANKQRLRESEALRSTRAAEKARMGEWLADYFDDAGYEGWPAYPELFKAMLMNAFPPIDALDSAATLEEGSLSQFEAKQLRFMAVMDDHLSLTSARRTAQDKAMIDLAAGHHKAV